MFDLLGKLQRVTRRNVIRIKVSLATRDCGKMTWSRYQPHDNNIIEHECNEPMVARSMYFPAGAAIKKSMPTPLSTILPASFLNPGWSVWNNFFSVSIPCKSFLSRRNSLPGPHVGNDAKEQTIFPPVALSDDNADSSVGSRAGSGFLTCEKRAGN